MDLYCSRCGEPYDMDHVNFEMSPEERARFKKGEGCPACYGKVVEKRPFRAQLAGALSEILGDDEDGAAAEMEDAEAMLGGKFWE
ncbi:MAG: hypothetical protein Q7T05_02280 [Dehalococcoidia bacterium]|nr:hypothetical protein [Dehalococcoidia bacterium]